jgi:hypothetical protein
MMAGISRLVAHAAGLTRLGNINPLLYKALGDGSLIADQNPDADIFDITVGNDAVGYSSGYDALTGFNLASGWGSQNIGNFVPDFAKVAAGVSPSKQSYHRSSTFRTVAVQFERSVVSRRQDREREGISRLWSCTGFLLPCNRPIPLLH